MKSLRAAAVLSIAMMALPCATRAQSQVAYTAKPVNLRAGPARDYPIVAVLPGGYPISVQGCVPQYTWCDVIAGAYRGWVYAGNINYFYQNTYVPVLTYGPVIGIAVLGFVLDDYWGRHYHDRPWYPERQRWSHHPPVPPARYGAPPRYAPPIPPRPGGVGPRPPHQRPEAIGPRPHAPPGVIARPQPPVGGRPGGGPPRHPPDAERSPRGQPQQHLAPGVPRGGPPHGGERRGHEPRAPRDEGGRDRPERIR